MPADEKDLGTVGMAAVASMRKNGKVIFASPTRARAAAHSLPLVLPLICHAPFPHVVCLCAVSPVRRADRQALPEEGGGGQDVQDQEEVRTTGDVGRPHAGCKRAPLPGQEPAEMLRSVDGLPDVEELQRGHHGGQDVHELQEPHL